MKRLFTIATCSLLIFSLLLPFSETAPLAYDSESEFTVLKNTKDHKTFKLKNGETLEQFNKGEEVYYIANTNEGSFKIVKENDVVSVINLQSNEIVETYTAKEISNDSNIIEPANSMDLSVLAEGSEMGTYAIPSPDPGSKYKYVRTRNMSLEIISASVSVVAGVIASFIGSPVTGAIVTVATGYVSYNLKKLYWKEYLYEYKENVYLYRMWSNVYYKYHDYTSELGTTVTFTKNRVW